MGPAGLTPTPLPTDTRAARRGREWHYLRGSIDVEHKGVVPGDGTPDPGPTLAPLVPQELQKAAYEALLRPRHGSFLKPERGTVREHGFHYPMSAIRKHSF